MELHKNFSVQQNLLMFQNYLLWNENNIFVKFCLRQELDTYLVDLCRDLQISTFEEWFGGLVGWFVKTKPCKTDPNEHGHSIATGCSWLTCVCFDSMPLKAFL